MKIGIPKEIFPGECRVAATPDTAAKLCNKLGFDIVVESDAGTAASFTDQAYRDAGCEVSDSATVWAADVILKVRPPDSSEAGSSEAGSSEAGSSEAGSSEAGSSEVSRLDAGKTLISFLSPAQNAPLLDALAARGTTALAMEAVPRISRAQKMDALSSMANIAGYRAVIEAANLFGRFFTGQITAAGKVSPAKVLVIGAGVAGLSAIGAARGLGAIVRGFDVRPEVAEQVKSMGADFLMLDFEPNTKDQPQGGGTTGGYAKTMSKEFIDAEMALFAAQAKEVDIIITTALIPGKAAPTLITREMVESMRPGSVVVDLATEQGGNCEVSEKDQVVNHAGVHVVGYSDLASRLASTSSQLYGTNLFHVLDDMGGAQNFHVDMDDDVIRSMTVVRDGAVTWPPPPVAVSAAPAESVRAKSVPANTARITAKSGSKLTSWIALFVAAVALVGIGLSKDPGLLTDFTVFILACIIGWQLIWNVSAALHTPLMSVTNAISGIIIVGGMIQCGTGNQIAAVLGITAIFFATINIAGGFLVTQRMLKMFRR